MYLFPAIEVVNAGCGFQNGWEGEVVGFCAGLRHVDVGGDGFAKAVGTGVGSEEFDP